ncbi:hypothetical protein HB662_28675 [Roseomonas frigidaquae]|uniref:TIGR03750 family conjugal transfer protein n=1 Tax=Falsiroseomonas frigidaquae TaxID=487318 RepID=A0ABX1F8R6_9PROT|nr:hypothetical protein [Falsiroseomonas frigidaquae]NKE48774.1 hypothetical protein [Falsiroseomonas frigidaquae]
MVRARNRSIQLSTIEGVEVSRPLFLMAIAGCAGAIGLSLIFGDLLYLHEIALLLVLGAGTLALSWHVGALKVFSKLTRQNGWTVHWWIGPLRLMREAVEKAMEDRSRPTSRPAYHHPPPSPPATPPRPSPAPPDDDATIRIFPQRRP